MKRFRYLDETIAVVLAVVAAKILIEELVKIGPIVSLGMVAVIFAAGIGLSLLADRRDPEGAEERKREMAEQGKVPAGAGAEPE
jgi:predicted tellurium resistance membrane protein TerC